MNIKLIMAVLAVSAFFGLAVALLRAWNKRREQQELSLSKPHEALEPFGDEIGRFPCQYVSTTFRTNSLERVIAHGLAARGWARVLVFENGLLVLRIGERSLAIPRQDLQEIRTVQITIDRAVETNGLCVINWAVSDLARKTDLATHLRFESSEQQKHFAALVDEIRKEKTK